MDTTAYAIVALLNSLAYDARQTSPVIPEPEFQSINLSHVAFTRKETEDTWTRSNNLHGNVPDAFLA